MNLKTVLLGIIALLLIITPIYAATTNYDIINLNADTYNYNPTPVISGEEFEIWIQLTNESNTAAKNIDYFLETEYPFILISENEGKIPVLEPYQTKIIKYKLKTNSDVVTGTYDLEFRYKRDGVSIYNIKKYIIDIKGQSAIVDVISSEIQEASIGNDSQFVLTLKNLGKKDAKDIFITVDDSVDEIIKVIDLKTQYLEKINVGEEKQIIFKINVSKVVTTSSYTLPITINYSDVDRNYNLTRNIGIKIIDQPKMILNITNVGTNFKIKPNNEEKISLEIYNIGNVDTEVSYVTIEGTNIKSTQEFIGSIEKNNYDTIDITLNTTNIDAKESTITVNLFYKDNTLKEQKITQTITVETDFSTNGKGVNNAIMSIFGIIGFILGLAVFILLLRWLIKILIKPAYRVIIGIFKRK
jgi:hypothetical protein